MATPQMRLISFAMVLVSALAAPKTDGVPRVSGSSTELLGLGSASVSRFSGAGAASLPALSGAVSGVHYSKYSDPKWDAAYKGTSMYWMGLGYGGCGYGNLLSANKWPHLMAVALSGPTRTALGIPSSTVGCGACVRITCPQGTAYCKPGSPSVIGVVTDICPDVGGHSSGNKCQTLHVDGYIKAWDLVGVDSNPKVVIERVQCPAPDGNVKLYVMESYGPQQFLKMNFQDVGGSGLLVSATMTCAGSSPMAMQLQYGAVFVTNHQPKKVNSCTFTLTTDDGTTLTTSPVDMSATGKMNEAEGINWVAVIDTGVQFGSSARGPPAMRAGGLGGSAEQPVKAASVAPPQGGASEVAPDTTYTCAQQALWGKCSEGFMQRKYNPVCPAAGCCATTCASAGRKLLR